MEKLVSLFASFLAISNFFQIFREKLQKLLPLQEKETVLGENAVPITTLAPTPTPTFILTVTPVVSETDGFVFEKKTMVTGKSRAEVYQKVKIILDGETVIDKTVEEKVESD